MFSDPLRTVDAVNNPKFLAGSDVVLSNGPHKYLRGVFLHPNEDVEWATIQEPNGAISSHPVEWLAAG